MKYSFMPLVVLRQLIENLKDAKNIKQKAIAGPNGEELNVEEALRSQSGKLTTFQSPLVYTVDIANLQAAINALPKFLDRDIVIKINVGTVSEQIILQNFSGPGSLEILGLAGAFQNHNVRNIVIRENTNKRIVITAINATAISGNAFESFMNSCAEVRFDHCSATEGSSVTPGFCGIVGSLTSHINIVGCIISNKERAIVSESNKINIFTTSGADNGIVYFAGAGGIIQRTACPITGTTMTAYANGGLIVNPGGALIGV